jgi:cAMP-dependent protein kinase regulator
MSRWAPGQSVEELLAQKKYDQAIELLEQRLEKEPENLRVRLQFGDALVSKGEKDRAAKILLGLVDQLAADGLVSQAIVALKKLKQVEPRRDGIEAELADSCQLESRHSPLFSDFSRDELLEVIRGLALRSFTPGAIVMTEGEDGDSLFILTTGTVRAFVKNQEGRNIEVRRMEEGEFFGEISLLTGNPRTATITAASACEILELDRQALEDITRQHPRVKTVVDEFYAQRAGSDLERDARSR